jgi:hypothetical protein
VDGGTAWWGWAQPVAGTGLVAAVLVLLGQQLGEELVVLRELGPGMWRCAQQIIVFVEDNAPCLSLQPADLSRFVPRIALAAGLVWLIPGREPQGVILTADGRMTWSEFGGMSSGHPQGKWERLVDSDGDYLAFNFHDFGLDLRGVRSVVLKRATNTDFAWYAVGTVDEFGNLLFELPQTFPEWHVVALRTKVPASRPRP